MSDTAKRDTHLTALSIFEEFGRQETALLTGAVLALGLAGPVQAADTAPAVSGPNAKLQLGGGQSGGDSLSAVTGSVSVPLGHSFGAQLDGMTGSLNSQNAKGAAVHLFTRNPDSYLAGLNAGKVQYRGVDVKRVGLAGELYRDNWTLSAGGGHQSGDLGSADYYQAGVRYYPQPDLALSAGAGGFDSNSRYSLGAEWQFLPGWSLGLEGGGGDGDDYVLAGVRFYLGGGRSLMQRQREDDPENGLLGAVGALRGAMDEVVVAGEFVPPPGG